MHNYFYTTFPNQIRLLEIRRPNQVVLEHIMRDDSVIFFGGRDWKNVSDDLSQIPPEDRPHFILSLFMVVLTDQCLFTYQPDSYPLWRQKTSFPKFGWSGFGPHNENPFKVLWAPERDKVVKTDEVVKLIPQFVEFMLEETYRFFDNSLPTVNSAKYFESIRQDGAYEFAQGQIVQSFKREFEALLNRSTGRS
jgi:hypothetical protein